MTEDQNDLDAFMAMDDDAQEAYLAGMHGEDAAAPAGEAAQVAGQGAGPEHDAAAQPEAQPAAQGEAQNPEAQTADGQKHVPYGALHEERGKRREAETRLEVAERQAQELQQRMSTLEQQIRQGASAPQAQNPQQAAQQDEAPGLVFEDPAAIDARVQAQLSPYLETIQHLQGMLTANQQRDQMLALAQQFQDPDLPAVIAEFDRQVPQFAQQGIDLVARYYMAKGIEARDPARAQAAQARMQADAQGAARQEQVAATAQRLAQPARQPSTPSLAGLPPAAANTPTLDPSGMSMSQFMNLDDAAEERMLRGE